MIETQPFDGEPATAAPHWSTIGIRNGRLLVLMTAFLLVGGLSSFMVLPRMEDPVLTPRAAIVTTLYPVADAEQVELLVTDRIEQAIREVEQIKEIRSQSRAGISFITIELRDDVYEPGPIWSRIRGKIEDSIALLPPDAQRPVFDALDVRAFAWIGGLVWTSQSAPNYAILGRFAKDLEDRIRALGGTDKVEQFGKPQEEIVVEFDPAELSNIGLSSQDIAGVIAGNDARSSAGVLRSGSESMPIAMANQLATIDSIRQLPIKNNVLGRSVLLGDVARVDRVIADPPAQLGQIDLQPALLLGAMVRQSNRIDLWRASLETVLKEFRNTLPPAIELQMVLDQNDYVENRLGELLANLILGALAVLVVVWVLMGWRNAVLVSTALPLVSMAVLAGMRALSIPIHQMSLAGLIIALGLLIDNAIVIVDSVSNLLAAGKSKIDAVSQTGKALFVPLLASTLTTALAFAPICLMEGPAGEFVGSMAVNVILAVSSSLFISLLIIAPLATVVKRPTLSGTQLSGNVQDVGPSVTLPQAGIAPGRLKPVFRKFLLGVVRFPKLTMAGCAVAALSGFWCLGQLPDQFFPAADRDQFHVELELPKNASFKELKALAEKVTEVINEHPRVQKTTWLLGRSAPAFYYNIVTRRQNAREYGQAIVQLDSDEDSISVIRQLQQQLQSDFPEARLLVRRLEQGPPFGAPIEVRFYGPDLDTLKGLGAQMQKILSEIPDVVHTRADMNESTPTVSVNVSAEDARLAGFQPNEIGTQISQQMDGSRGGFILQTTEQIPVRVRATGNRRATFGDLQSVDLVPSGGLGNNKTRVPLSAVATLTLEPKTSTLSRQNSIRMQEVQAFLTAGVLPSTVMQELNHRLAQGALDLPAGYRLAFGGEASKRSDAVSNLMASVGVLVAAVIMTLVLAIGSFRGALMIGAVAIMAIGFGGTSLFIFGYPFGFMAIVGIMGLLGIAINDSIVVLTALQQNPEAAAGSREAIVAVTLHETRHVLATTFTTVAGFVPLILSGGGFWPPLAIAIAGGVVGCTVLALVFVPAAFTSMHQKVAD